MVEREILLVGKQIDDIVKNGNIVIIKIRIKQEVKGNNDIIVDSVVY